MTRVLVVGGEQDRAAGPLDRRHGPLYGWGVVTELVPDAPIAVPRLRWRDPDAPVGVGHAFTGAAWDGDRLLLTTPSALVWVDVVGWRVVQVLRHPRFADLHHAVAVGERRFVANTGRDEVLELAGARVVGEWSVVGPRGDRAHPNHLFVRDGRVWVTRFHQRDAIGLEGGQIRVGVERPHDGVPGSDGVWFTTVDGRLVCGDLDRPAIVVPILPPDADPQPLGWCRGLAFADGSAWVGFTRLRATRFRERLAWTRGALRGRQIATRRPSRVCRVDPSTGAVLATVPGPDLVGALLVAR